MSFPAAVELFDSTLRDGAQGEGISFSVEDKLHITRALDELGIQYIECGNPSSNPKDMEFFERIRSFRMDHATLVAFGATCRKGEAPEEDEGLRALLAADTPCVAVFGKCSPLHVMEILGTTKEENLRMIGQTCRFLSAQGRRVFFDAEHFFDGYRLDADYAMECLRVAVEGGAVSLCLCDTNGGSQPWEIADITGRVCARFSMPVAIHCHNDSGTAIASTIMAVRAGASQVQGTFLGIGERCGNTALTAVIGNLQGKLGVRCIPEQNLPLLTSTAREIAELCNIPVDSSAPFIGHSAFAHKAGMHVDGVCKLPASFEHIPPERVGNTRRLLTSEISGRAAVYEKVRKILPGLPKDSPALERILGELKHLEHLGYQFEGAGGSFELLVKRQLGIFHDSFRLVSYKVIDELPYPEGCSATATIKIRVGDRLQISAAEGEGPVNALDRALREALEVFYPALHDVRLIDYKVRVLEPKEATAAHVRVLITSADRKGVWTTVGVSTNLIEASWLALVDSMEYKLNREYSKEDGKWNKS